MELNKDLIPTLKIRLTDAKRNSKKRGGDAQTVDLTVDDLVELYMEQDGRCASMGCQLTFTTKDNATGRYGTENRWSTLSIDRLDNSKGYVKGNVRLICWAANCMRLTLSVEEADAQAETFFSEIMELRQS